MTTSVGLRVFLLYGCSEAASIGATVTYFNPDKPFSFADYPITRARVDKLPSSLKNNVKTVIVNGIDSEWTLSNNKNNELCNTVFGKKAKRLTAIQEQVLQQKRSSSRCLLCEEDRRSEPLRQSVKLHRPVQGGNQDGTRSQPQKRAVS